jgi:TRAP-type C4-dicarboxylate transport system permease small subunit
MNKWALRITGVLMVLIFLLVFMQLYRQLVALQRLQQADPPASTDTTT